ncbi:MAG TPA: hypothetical protein VK617_05625 [Gemmatimonadaceae bacterium]|nr:hypothetical protein [Gemmatimonadaceae bacterium]
MLGVIMNGRLFVVLVSLAIMIAACGRSSTDPSAGRRVQATASENDYVIGDTIQVDVKNLTGETLEYPAYFCPSVLQQLQGGEWVTVQSDHICNAVLALLDGFGHATFWTIVPAGLQGRFRLLLPTPLPVDAPPESPLIVEFSVHSAS